MKKLLEISLLVTSCLARFKPKTGELDSDPQTRRDNRQQHVCLDSLEEGRSVDGSLNIPQCILWPNLICWVIRFACLNLSQVLFNVLSHQGCCWLIGRANSLLGVNCWDMFKCLTTWFLKRKTYLMANQHDEGPPFVLFYLNLDWYFVYGTGYVSSASIIGPTISCQ